MTVKDRKTFGKNLEAVLGELVTVEDSTIALQQLPHACLYPGKSQPRQDYNSDALQSLAESIRRQGILQPIIVRADQNQERYEIIAGERRWRAAKLAGLTEVPVIIRQVGDEDAAIIALIENMQREDLNPLEEAIGLEKLIVEYKLTQEQVAEAIGKSRTTITNLMRLLGLEPNVKQYLKTGSIDMGHARALLALTGKQQIDAASFVIERHLSVRQTEKLVSKLKKSAGQTLQIDVVVNHEITDCQDKLIQMGLQAHIIAKSPKNIKVTLNFASLAKLLKWIERLSE